MSVSGRNSDEQPPVVRLVVHIKTIVKAAVIAFIVLATAAFLVVRATEKPEFCTRCHIMKPYYQAWKSSTHNGVPCIECHYPPGIQGTFEGKFKALSQVAKYVTGTAGTRPWAEIPDESCLREGCHERRLLQGTVEFGPVVFDHRPHLLGMRRGKQLRCTSCHSQMVMGTHISVTESTCFICHFKDKTDAELWDSCRVCHRETKKKVRVEGREFDHALYTDRGVPCMKCHVEVVNGRGVVPRERCYSCHSEEKHTARYGNTPLIHRKHVTEHKVECFDCHLEIKHESTAARADVPPNCEECHAGTHRAQVELYLGEGGRRVKPYVNEMAARQVDCRACHIANPNSPDDEFTGATLQTRAAACMACHGVEYKDVLDGWKRAVKMMLEETARLAQRARAAKARWKLEKDDRAAAETLFNDAMHNYRLVRLGGGVHNVHYSRELLRKANGIFTALLDPRPEYLRSAGALAGKPESLPPDVNCTKLCHATAPDREIVFFDRTFPHARHGPHKGTPCTACHTSDVHGGTLITLESCKECHHSSKAAAAAGCRNCHAKNLPDRIGKNFPHRNHFERHGVRCADCHQFQETTGRMTLARSCGSCHHAEKTAKCEKCHADQAAKVAAGSMDYDCSFCHEPAMIGIEKPYQKCAKCHGLQAAEEKERHGAAGCDACHFSHTWNFRGADACAACHKDFSHSRDAGGDCLLCHKPHAWAGRHE
ncbi:MAG: NapC/NirT family cytochrome c [bacterium]